MRDRERVCVCRGLFLGCLFFLCCFSLFGCGTPKADGENSPVLNNVSLESRNEGSDDTQYVDVSLVFDGEVCWQEKYLDTLSVTISEDRVAEEDMELQQGESENELILSIRVDAVTNGTLRVERDETADAISAITSADGACASADFRIDALIPSGVELADLTEESGDASGNPQVSKQVVHAWNIRSIAWVQLLENGEPVEVGEDKNIEILDQAVAVHGHEFLQEDEYSAAETIAETLANYYGSDYVFSSADDVVRVEKVSGDLDVELDLEIYSYLNVVSEGITEDGDTEASVSSESEEESEEESTGSKVKEAEINRELTAEEQEFVDALHISHMDDSAVAAVAYRILVVTGDALGEEENYSVHDLETLASLCYQNQSMNAVDFTVTEDHSSEDSCACVWKGHRLQGLDLKAFLELAGVDFSEDVYVSCYAGSASGVQQELTSPAQTFCLSDDSMRAILVLAVDGQPLVDGMTEQEGPVALAIIGEDEMTCVDSLGKLIVGNEETPTDPEYGFHRYEPYTESADATFTVNVYDSNAPYLGALISKTFTTEEIESLIEQYPEHVYRNYYGLIGNQEEFESMGVGGWQDCFTGIDLHWFLTDQVGLESFSGYAELYGRDDDLYATIDDISYFEWEDRAEQYNVVNRNGEVIPYAIPMISCIKNGHPILPEHDHESSGYIPYNQLNNTLEDLGVSVSVGEVKNDKGPFVACLGNLSGMFGGYQVETGGDCVRMDIYLN